MWTSEYAAVSNLIFLWKLLSKKIFRNFFFSTHVVGLPKIPENTLWYVKFLKSCYFKNDKFVVVSIIKPMPVVWIRGNTHLIQFYGTMPHERGHWGYVLFLSPRFVTYSLSSTCLKLADAVFLWTAVIDDILYCILGIGVFGVLRARPVLGHKCQHISRPLLLWYDMAL